MADGGSVPSGIGSIVRAKGLLSEMADRLNTYVGEQRAQTQTIRGLLGNPDTASQGWSQIFDPQRIMNSPAANIGGSFAPLGINALHGSSAIFDHFSIQNDKNPALFFSQSKPGKRSQAEYIAGGPFGGQLYKVAIGDTKQFDPLNDKTAANIYSSIFPDRPIRQWVEYPDIYKGSPLIEAMQQHGYNHVRVREPSVQDFSDAITDPSLVTILDRSEVGRLPPEAWNDVHMRDPGP